MNSQTCLWENNNNNSGEKKQTKKSFSFRNKNIFVNSGVEKDAVV